MFFLTPLLSFSFIGQPVILTFARDPAVKGSDSSWICYRKWKPYFRDGCWEKEWVGLKRGKKRERESGREEKRRGDEKRTREEQES
jgi:hypothetical protein